MDASNHSDNFIASHMHAVQGVVHIIERKEDRVAAAFFNAGVTLARLSRGEPYKSLPVVYTRIILNLIGAYYSLVFNSSLRDAMLVNDGFDCCVNFAGAVSALFDINPVEADKLLKPDADIDGAQGAQDLILQIISLSRAFRNDAFEYQTRIEASLKSMRIPLVQVAPTNLQGLTQKMGNTLATAIRLYTKDHAFGDQLLDGEPGAVAVAAVVKRVFDLLDAASIETEKVKVADHVREVSKKLLGQLKQEFDVASAIEVAYDHKIGPLADAGFTHPRWSDVVAQYSGESSAEMLSEAFERKQW